MRAGALHVQQRFLRFPLPPKVVQGHGGADRREDILLLDLRKYRQGRGGSFVEELDDAEREGGAGRPGSDLEAAVGRRARQVELAVARQNPRLPAPAAGLTPVAKTSLRASAGSPSIFGSAPETHSTGEAFVEAPGEVHMVQNLGSEPVVIQFSAVLPGCYGGFNDTVLVGAPFCHRGAPLLDHVPSCAELARFCTLDPSGLGFACPDWLTRPRDDDEDSRSCKDR